MLVNAMRSDRDRTKRRWRRFVSATAAVAVAGAGLAMLGRSLEPPPLDSARRTSVVVLDRNDRLLRAFTTPDGRWRLPVSAADVDPRYLAMLKAFEDRRFDQHSGVDAMAVGRAAVQLVRHRRIVSGASTLTMQVVRLLEREHGRSVSAKLGQMLGALALERRLTKAEILDVYLTMAPFGGNIEGVRAGALAYFGKEPRRLSPGEAALLVALPQSPETRRPDRNPAAIERARNRVLDRAVAAGVLAPAEAERAKREPVPTSRRDFARLAPHLAEAEATAHPDRSVHRLTIDRDLQASLETLARQHARGLGPQLSAAAVVVDNATGALLAYVGSADLLDHTRLGGNDMVQAVRSPGSTLKPLIYGLGFEAGLAHPETLIEDRPARFGSYAPRNFDEDFHGTVSVREALAQSLNIPAVKMLDAVGPGRMLGRFRRVGVAAVLPGGNEPTLAIALGGLGLRLKDLAQLYVALARGGEPIALIHRQADLRARRPGSQAVGTGQRRLLAADAAWHVTDILKDAPPPAHARGGRLAYKTGTSYGYRDAWAIGYDGAYTVAVWVGRPDGSATPGLSGRSAAAPLLFEAFQRIGADRVALPPPPAGNLRVTAAELPPPLKRFREAGEHEPVGVFLEPPVAIAFPPDRSEVEVGADGGTLVVRAENGTLPLTWLVDGRPVATAPHQREAQITAEPGFLRVTVIDAVGRVDRVSVRVR
jgi:penicillin-binding protein 1C